MFMSKVQFPSRNHVAEVKSDEGTEIKAELKYEAQPEGLALALDQGFYDGQLWSNSNNNWPTPEDTKVYNDTKIYDDTKIFDGTNAVLARSFDFFDVVVRPKLRGGHEGELVQWLKEENLLKSGVQCRNPQCNSRWTNWTSQSRITDKYIWLCNKCLEKVIIRDGSFFLKQKCELKIIMEIMMGWCKNVPYELLANNIRYEHGISVKCEVMKRIYTRCSEVTSCHMLEFGKQWMLGGSGSVVIVDTYPDGYMAPPPPTANGVGPVKKKPRHQQQYILCLADLSVLPPLTWLQIVKPDPGVERPGKSGAAVTGLVEDALHVVCRHVRAGSALVANGRSRCCSAEALRELPGFASVTSAECLAELDAPGTRRLHDNLETIWQNVVSVCESIQDVHMNDRQATIALHEHMWRQKFGENAFERLIRHISHQYKF